MKKIKSLQKKPKSEWESFFYHDDIQGNLELQYSRKRDLIKEIIYSEYDGSTSERITSDYNLNDAEEEAFNNAFPDINGED